MELSNDRLFVRWYKWWKINVSTSSHRDLDKGTDLCDMVKVGVFLPVFTFVFFTALFTLLAFTFFGLSMLMYNAVSWGFVLIWLGLAFFVWQLIRTSREKEQRRNNYFIEHGHFPKDEPSVIRTYWQSIKDKTCVMVTWKD